MFGVCKQHFCQLLIYSKSYWLVDTKNWCNSISAGFWHMVAIKSGSSPVLWMPHFEVIRGPTDIRVKSCGTRALLENFQDIHNITLLLPWDPSWIPHISQNMGIKRTTTKSNICKLEYHNQNEISELRLIWVCIATGTVQSNLSGIDIVCSVQFSLEFLY